MPELIDYKRILKNKPPGEWFYTNEVLPEDNYRVLVTNGEYVMEAYRRGGRWISSFYGNDLKKEVRLWREIPSPPMNQLPPIPTIQLTNKKPI